MSRPALRDRLHRAPRKSVLYCQACGHDSPADGDWRVSPVDADPERVVYACPDCGHSITTRPVARPAHV
ncbi:hypothetical protein BRC90_06430 [Halobacteriales archaeon QS_4_69_34]|nr:MAG: hypothetical protein BRC90_06430 [Halobacteriales archaeon QS_4_69_34]